MKLSEFSKPAPPASPGVSPSSPQEPPVASQEAPQEEQYFTSITPSGIEVAYSPAPRRHYRLSIDQEPYWVEVPSVTTILGVLDRSGPLTWWGMKVGVAGCIELSKGVTDIEDFWGDENTPDDVDGLVSLLTTHKLTVNHVKDSAADRGVNVHGDLEAWVKNGTMPSIKDRPEAEWGYIQGLAEFLLDVEVSSGGGRECELMVGSLEHSYAGRFDLVLTLSKPVEVVTRAYPKRPPKIEEIPAGRWIVDLKTSKNCYPTHALQLAAYRGAMVECGYGDVDHMAVLHVTADGRYEFRPAIATLDEFLAVKSAHDAMERKDWFANSIEDLLPENEREVLAVLTNELGAKEVSG